MSTARLLVDRCGTQVEQPDFGWLMCLAMASWWGKPPFPQLGQRGMTLSEILQSETQRSIGARFHDSHFQRNYAQLYIHDTNLELEASSFASEEFAGLSSCRGKKLLAECLVREHEKIANLHRFKANQRQDSIDNSDLNVGWIKAVFNNHDRSQLSDYAYLTLPPHHKKDRTQMCRNSPMVLYYLYVLWLDLNGFAGAIGGLWASWNIVW
ncbi:hypothetical protein EDD15DRAFT_2197243 [Pisolithus albus]|nr:hypothetical protein EDD15DRAFT_2197243 [Pisolithus albus]